MFCIAAFIVVLLMAAVSAKYRKYVKRAWGCVARRVTFRACDTTFKQDIKDHMLAPIALKHPRLVKPASVGIEVVAWLLVITTVVSLYIVLKSGLNLWVYGTCNPQNSESCTLGAQACSIESATPSFGESLAKFDVVGAFGNEFKQLGDTFAAIPSRVKNWDAADYLPKDPSYYAAYDSAKPTALEIVDPGCVFCRRLFANIKQAGFENKVNLTYIAYPINVDGKYKFANSLQIAQYLESLKLHPLASASASEPPADWRLLEQIYTAKDASGKPIQEVINASSASTVHTLIHSWLSDFGYSDAQIAAIDETATSTEVADRIAANERIVKERVNTVKIPTIIFGGARHDGLVGVNDLK